jgi:hypothetical protein
MNDRRMMRASDHDREQVVERLRSAVEDGRLTPEEYVNRMGLAYQAVTYGDLAPLHADLPAAGSITEPQAARPTVAPLGFLAWRSAMAGLPVVLKVLWTIWLVAVSINAVVWTLVSISKGHLAYPWPGWVAGPYGAALFALSACVIQFRRGRPAGERRLSPGNG